MKRIWLLILPTIAALSAAFLFADLQGKGLRGATVTATMTESRGTIRRLAKGALDWDVVDNGAGFADGDAISVGESGSAVLILKSGARVELSEGSMTIVGPETPSSLTTASTELDLRKRVATSGMVRMDLPATPSLVSPENATKILFAKTADVELRWSKDSLASRYEITVTPLNHVEDRKVISSAEPTLRFQTPAEGQYVWTVTAIDASGGRSVHSAERSFDLVRSKAPVQETAEKTIAPPARLPARAMPLPATRTQVPVKKAETPVKRRKGPAPKPVLLAPRAIPRRENEPPKPNP